MIQSLEDVNCCCYPYFFLWYKKSRKWKFHFSPGIDKQKLEIKQFWLISLREEQPGIVDLEFPEEISFLSSNETFMRKASFCGQRGIRTITEFRYRIKRGNLPRKNWFAFHFISSLDSWSLIILPLKASKCTFRILLTYFQIFGCDF